MDQWVEVTPKTKVYKTAKTQYIIGYFQQYRIIRTHGQEQKVRADGEYIYPINVFDLGPLNRSTIDSNGLYWQLTHYMELVLPRPPKL